MAQIFIPGETSFRMQHGPGDMARGRIANQFGVRGLVGENDPRSGSAVQVLPMVRGHEGWFYGDGHRAQTRIRGIGKLNLTSADYQRYAAMAPAGSMAQGILLTLAADPGSSQWSDSYIQSVITELNPTDQNALSQEVQQQIAVATHGTAFQPSGTVANTPSASLVNTTRGGQSFQVGDSWKLVFTGPANQPVYIVSTHNGQSLGKSQWGTTDANGTFTLTGTMTTNEVGNWSENYYVGNVAVGSASFQVQAAPTATGATTQQDASTATNKPNQSVPPRTPTVPMPTGTGANGGNPLLCDPGPCPGQSSGHGGLILLLIGGGLLYMMGRH